METQPRGMISRVNWLWSITKTKITQLYIYIYIYIITWHWYIYISVTLIYIYIYNDIYIYIYIYIYIHIHIHISLIDRVHQVKGKLHFVDAGLQDNKHVKFDYLHCSGKNWWFQAFFFLNFQLIFLHFTEIHLKKSQTLTTTKARTSCNIKAAKKQYY